MLFALLLVNTTELEAQTDSLYIEETTITSSLRTSALKSIPLTGTEVDLAKIQKMPAIFGNTDPLNFIKTFAGVQTGSEYDSGIYIQGCDNGHNNLNINGVPVFGATHLFGLFSVFNPSHFGEMKFSRSTPVIGTSNRLGGEITMNLPDTTRYPVTGDLSIGLISSQGTFRFKLGNKAYLHISARQSYMNLLYQKWLQVDGEPLRYGFNDFNATFCADLTDKDRIWADAYLGNDKMDMGTMKYNISIGAKWGNATGALHWNHTGENANFRNSIFASRYGIENAIIQNDIRLQIPSDITALGYKGQVRWKDITLGTDITYYVTRPQNPEYEDSNTSDTAQVPVQKGLEGDIYAGYARNLSGNWKIDAGIKGSFFTNLGTAPDFRLSPSLMVSYNAYHLGKAYASYGWQHQYVFQAGLSNIGLPFDFWFLAGSYSKPQSAHTFSLGYEKTFFNGMFSVNADLYYKSLDNQVEYHGDIFDFLSKDYDLERYLHSGKGLNYGVNLMVQKQSGALTGWISYSLGRALRKFNDPEYPGIYPANHERIHEMNAVCSYDLRRWNFSGNFVFASGLPFTAPEAFYISSGMLVTQYGEHNSARMRPYIRLDLAVNFKLTDKGRTESGLNASVYNVLGRNNEVMWKLDVNEQNEFYYRPVAYIMRIMPSISYYYRF